MFYDAHTHLNSPELFEDFEIYIKEFIKIWWEKIVNVWIDKIRTEKALKIQEKYPNICYSTIWFHPSEAVFNKEFKQNKEKYLKYTENYIEKIIKEKKVIAIWECWLDYHYKVDENIIENQKKLFILQCELAKKYNYPIVVHSRDAFKDSIDILKKYNNLRIYFHCWWYDVKEIEILEDIFPNLWIGFDWNITYKKADNIRNSLKITKKEHILLETDAPYLTPQTLRKHQNKPSYIVYIYEFISNLLWIEQKDLEKQIKQNFNNFFSI